MIVERKSPLVEPPQTAEILLKRIHRWAGQPVRALAAAFKLSVPPDLRSHKGWVGHMLEQCLGATAGSRPVPDFEALGIEMKSLPVSSTGKPMESTYVSLVPLTDLHRMTWELSHLRAKLSQVLWVPVEGIRDKPLAERRIGRAFLWKPDADEWRLLREDWEELTDVIRLGEVDMLDGRMGQVLQIRPKGLNSEQRVRGIDKDGHVGPVAPRGFYLRASFTERIIRRHLVAPVASS
jgi:DNA mismatch repair protein MutH